MSSPAPPCRYTNSIKSDVSDELVNVYIQRPLAGLIIRVLYATSVTPDQFTAVSILFGIGGGVLLAMAGGPLPVAALCFYLKDIFDSADGQLARAKQISSRRGRFFDSIGDFIVDVSLFAGVCFYLSREGTPLFASLAVSLAGLLGVSLRVSYHVFYQTSYLHSMGRYSTNRITEEFREEDLQEDPATVRLQRVFQLVYGWQDRLMVRLDKWCFGGKGGEVKGAWSTWYQDTVGLRLSGLIGFGTEFVALSICLLLGSVAAYLYISIVLLNAVWLSAVAYRKFILAGKI